MSSFDLLSTVQPTEGWFAIVGIKGKGGVRQKLVATREEADAVIQQFQEQEWNVFFGVAKYKTDDSRKKENVLSIKAFWVDIDCGPDKVKPHAPPEGYATQKEALAALKDFSELVGLPLPVTVNSGRGIHAYWVLKEAVTREQWEPVADKLAAVCKTQRFHVDPAVFEAARILRVPGTFNYKNNPPLPVAVIRGKVEEISIEEVGELIGVDVAAPSETDTAAPVVPTSERKAEMERRRQESPLYQLQKEALSKSFNKIMLRSMKGTGCEQLKLAYDERATLSYNRWWNAISIAMYCDDADASIRKLSQDHPTYDPKAVERVIASTEAPHKCTTFEKDFPEGCAGCPKKGTITNPLYFGQTLVPHTAGGEKIIAGEPGPSPIPLDENAADAIPEKLVHPYMWGPNGAIYKEEGEEKDPRLVYEHRLYLMKRMHDAVNGEVIIIRLHLPKDEIRTFNTTNSTLANAQSLRTILAKHGVVCGGDRRFNAIFEYLNHALGALQYNNKAEEMRNQLGWADKDTKFILGDKEYTKTETFHSPPSSATKKTAGFMQPAGTLEKWKEVFDLYGRPGLEPHAFAALTAFGSPLFKFTGHKGAVINVIHPTSGTGKSTILRMANSVYGDPDGLCYPSNDTVNSRIHKFGVHNNIHNCIDEITNMAPYKFSDLAYAITGGTGKDRMKASTNELRENFATWQSLTVCSSNSSFYEKLCTIKQNPDGERMRVFEYKIEKVPAISTEEGAQYFDDQLMANYGTFGPLYIDWLVKNKDTGVGYLKDAMAKVGRDCEFTSRERFWLGAIASNMAGGLIVARHLNGCSWNLKRIYDWVVEEAKTLKSESAPQGLNPSGVIGEYVINNMQNMLVINGAADKRSSMAPVPIREPRGALHIRFEPDTNKLCLVVNPFKESCVDKQINYTETVSALKKVGALTAGSQRIGKGLTGINFSIHCLILDTTKECFKPLLANLESIASESGED